MGSYYSFKENEVRNLQPYKFNSRGKNRILEIELLTSELRNIIKHPGNAGRDVIFLCIGSDRYIGDSLGPLVGSMLNESNITYLVYGTLEEPVHAFNLKETLKKINRRFKNPLIFSIDASLGTREQVGYVIFEEGPLIPGKALKTILPEVGDYNFKGIVNYIDPLPKGQFLNDTRLFTVMNLSKAIVEVITRIDDMDNAANDQ
ncbi:spore protease YyaC [Sporosarcina sp. P7]|uniref:spore protease YyaC n=1 Tax=Sporosarcina sp. P7 TaxID=2048244 RepID=UPI000C16E4D9|nr:spore protease YyaC [Sporosarcina sp. P7]PID24200.1 spore protease YyaC [Sporosarcina sp. P7]